MPGMREQEILSPPEILAVPRGVWGRIGCDPCAPQGGNHVKARVTYDGSNADGLKETWLNECYANVPYGKLRLWMEKAAGEKTEEMMMLFPVRSHRVWWCYLLPDIADLICWLRPVKFVGYKQAFPAPLVLTYRGVEAGPFREKCAGLGHVTENLF